MSMTTWDTETTTATLFKRKASPFSPDNWVVTHAFKPRNGEVTEHRFGHQRPGPGWLKPVLEGTRLLVGFNIKFDLLHALQDEENLAAWMEYVSSGGKVWDCQLAEYLLNGMGQADQMLSLDEVAPRYGGNVKVDEVKLLWAAGVNTPDIEPALLTRYLCGGPDEYGMYQKGDIENTESVALGQIARARNAGQLDSILLNMGALLFTVEAERNGMFVDKASGMEAAAKLDAEVDRLTEAMAQYLPQDLPFDFNWNSRFHKSALIFGGTVSYDCRQYDLADGRTSWVAPNEAPATEGGTYLYAQKEEEHIVLANGKTMERLWWEHMQWNPDGTDTEASCYKGGKNAGEPKTKRVKVNDLTKPKGRIAKREFTFPGYTAPSKKWATAEPGVYSTSSEVIEELGVRDIPFLKSYASLMKLAKDLGTYYYKLDEAKGTASGMLTLVDAEGIIHHKLNMCSTVTARLSSSDPNLQNIPKGNKSDVKLLFVSRFPGGKIIQSDFSSLEVYVQAILTGCKQLIEDLKSGLDLHVVRLAAKEGMSYDDVFALCKGDKYDKEWDYKRTGAKVYSFQRAFGAGSKKIADSTGMAIEDVEALSAAEDKRYPEIPTYYEDITKRIKMSATEGRTLPHPEHPGVICRLHRSTFRTPDGKVYSYQEQPSPEYLVKKGILSSFSPTEIRNYVVQGTGGEWAKAAMYLAVMAFYARKNFGGRALLVNQVHDAVYVDSHPDVAFEAAALLHACMEAASDFMVYTFDWNIPLPVPSDTTWGASMMDEDKIPGLTERAAVLRTELREQYMGGMTPPYLY